MKKYVRTLLMTGFGVMLTACGASEPSTIGPNLTELSTTEASATEPSTTQIEKEYTPVVSELINYEASNNATISKVYAQMELILLIFRLSGAAEFGDERTPYQRSLAPTFEAFVDHPAVAYARHLRETRGVGFDAPTWLALYLEPCGEGFRLKEDAAFWYIATRWTPENVAEFIPLINDFYIQSGFRDFFESHAAYFDEISQRVERELLSQINFDWFYQFGFGPDELRVTIYPSGSRSGFGPTARGVAYAVLPVATYFGHFLDFAIHEFAHSWANPIAEVWYEENEEFRRMSDDSVDLVRMPFYPTGLVMAYEYVTRAYTILYLVENHNFNLVRLLLNEIANGFPYIEHVYAMITPHEIILPR